MPIVWLPISNPDVEEAMHYNNVATPLKIAFWNAQRISNTALAEKGNFARRLVQRYGYDAVILCEAVGELNGFQLFTPIRGSTHRFKLKTLVDQATAPSWHEIDTMGVMTLGDANEADMGEAAANEEENGVEAELQALPAQEVDVAGGQAADLAAVTDGSWWLNYRVQKKNATAAKLRRPVVAAIGVPGRVLGLAALHAPSGGRTNPVNATTLVATMGFLNRYFQDGWVLFGDLNLDPIKGFRRGGVREFLGLGNTVGYVEEVFTHRSQKYGESTLDYAFCSQSMVGRVSVNTPHDYGPSDHKPIVVTITPPPPPPPDENAMEVVPNENAMEEVQE